MKKFFAGLLTAALALVFASCTHSGGPSPSAGALNTFNTEAAASDGKDVMPSSSVTADGTADAAHPSGTNAQKDYPDIVGRNGAANLLGGGRAIYADNYIYFTAGLTEWGNTNVATYRMDTRTEEIEYFSQDVMTNMFIVDEWIYFNVYDEKTREASASYRMHSDGTDRTKLPYIIPAYNICDNLCYLDGYIYYFDWDNSNPDDECHVLYRRLISGEDEPYELMRLKPGERFWSLCTDGNNLFYVLYDGETSFAYKIEGLQSVPVGEDSYYDLIYGEGYLWGSCVTDDDYGMVGRIGIDSGRYNAVYRPSEFMEDFYSIANLNVYEGYVYIYNYDYIIRTDLNFENPEFVFEAWGQDRLIDIIKADDRRVYLLGDYIYVEGYFDFLGGNKNEYALLIRNDGSEKQTYMILQSEFEEDELMVWRERP